MGIKDWLGLNLGEQAAKPIVALGSLIDEAFSSDEELLDKQAMLERVRQSPHLLALHIALKEAQSGDPVVRRARPYGLYVFWTVFGVQSGLLPVIWWIWQTFDKTLAPPPAVLAASDVMVVMAGILGTSYVAGRTLEKREGKA